MNPSPLRYPGGKYKLYNYIAELVRVNDCTTYIEPFCGGAAVAIELLLNGIVNKIIINDYDYTIYCFWYSILYETEAFIELIQNVDVSLQEWHAQKNIRNGIDYYDMLEIGFSTFFLNRTNRSGIIDKAGPIGGLNQTGNYAIDCRFNKERLITQIRRIAEQREHIKLYNMEALTFIEEVVVHTKKSFVLFDPPYYGRGPELYTNFYTHGDHLNLSKAILTKLKNRKWVVTYDNVNAIKSMYRKVRSIEISLQYTLQEKRKSSEVLFFSRTVVRPQNEQALVKVL